MLIMSWFLISACLKSDVEDTNIEVITEVLELQFTGPDEEFMELIWNPKYTQVVNNNEMPYSEKKSDAINSKVFK